MIEVRQWVKDRRNPTEEEIGELAKTINSLDEKDIDYELQPPKEIVVKDIKGVGNGN